MAHLMCHHECVEKRGHSSEGLPKTRWLHNRPYASDFYRVPFEVRGPSSPVGLPIPSVVCSFYLCSNTSALGVVPVKWILVCCGIHCGGIIPGRTWGMVLARLLADGVTIATVPVVSACTQCVIICDTGSDRHKSMGVGAVCLVIGTKVPSTDPHR